MKNVKHSGVRAVFGKMLTVIVAVAMVMSVMPAMAAMAEDQVHFTDTLIENAGEAIIDMSVKEYTPDVDKNVAAYLGEDWVAEADGGGTWNVNDSRFNGGNLGDHAANVKTYYLQTSEEFTEDKNTPINVLQFWAEKVSSDYAIRAVKPRKTVSDEDKKDYYILEFYPSAGEEGSAYLNFGDIAFYDDAHNFITSFRYGMGDQASISPYWSFNGGGAKYGGEFVPVNYDLAGTDINKETVKNGFRIRRRKLVRVLVVNNEENNTHSVQWFYKGGLDESADRDDGTQIDNKANDGYINRTDEWTYFFGATYNGTVYGLGKIEAYRLGAANSWQHLGIGNLKVYGGNYSDDETEYELPGIYECQVGANPDLPLQVDIDGTTYDVSWDAIDTSSVGEKDITGTVVETGRKVKAKLSVKNLEAFLEHYYKFNEKNGAVTLADSKGNATGTVIGDANIHNGKLFIGNDTGHVKIDTPMLKEGQKQLTVSAWIYRTAYTANCPLFAFGTDTDNLCFFDLEAGAFNSKFAIKNTTQGYSEKKFGSQNNGFVDASGWHHIALTVSSSDIVTLYVNGNKIGADTLDNYKLTDLIGNNNYIGWNGDDAYNSFDGLINDFKVYSVAMTDADVAREAQNRPGDCAELISFSDPALAYDNDGGLYIKYEVDFSEAKSAFTNVNPETDKYRVHVYAVGGTELQTEEVTVNDSGRVTLCFNPTNSNVPIYISAERDYNDYQKNNSAQLLSNGNSKTTSLYEEVLKELGSGGYQVTDKVNPARLAAANAVIGRGGLAAVESLDDVRNNIMKCENNTVTIITPFKELGIGFMYSAGSLYVGDTQVENGEESAVYQSITLKDGVVTLGDMVGGNGSETVSITLNAEQTQMIQGLFSALEADAEIGVVPEL